VGGEARRWSAIARRAPVGGILVAAARLDEEARRVAAVSRDDVDDAVDGVCAPERGAGTADDLDAIDVFQLVIERVPEHAGEQRAVDGAAVDQNQHLVGGDRGEPACGDRPRAVVEPRDVDAVGERDRVGECRHARPPDVVAGDDRDRRWRRRDRFRPPRRERDIDLHQLLDGEPLEILRSGL
jgi:hypothetical protein